MNINYHIQVQTLHRESPSRAYIPSFSTAKLMHRYLYYLANVNFEERFAVQISYKTLKPVSVLSIRVSFCMNGNANRVF